MMDEDHSMEPSKLLKEFSESISHSIDVASRERSDALRSIYREIPLVILVGFALLFFLAYPDVGESAFSNFATKWRTVILTICAIVLGIEIVAIGFFSQKAARIKGDFVEVNQHKVDILLGLTARLRQSRDRLTETQREARFAEEFRLIEAEATLERYRRFVSNERTTR